MTMQAIAIQQQMLSSFPPVAPAPQSPPSQHHSQPHSHTPSPVNKQHTNTARGDAWTHTWRHLSACIQIRNIVLQINAYPALSLPVSLQTKEKEDSPYKPGPAAVQRKISMFCTLWIKLREACCVVWMLWLILQDAPWFSCRVLWTEKLLKYLKRKRKRKTLMHCNTVLCSLLHQIEKLGLTEILVLTSVHLDLINYSCFYNLHL